MQRLELSGRFEIPVHIKERIYEFGPFELERATFYESGIPMVDISEKSALGRCVAFEEEKPYYLRLPEARMLANAARLLHQNHPELTLFVRDAWRSLETQTEYFNKELENTRRKFPHFSESQIYSHTIKTAADPAAPFHRSGAALDVHLVDRKGKELDMGIKDPVHGDEYDYRDCNLVSDEAFLRRIILSDAMARAKFIMPREECWHFDGKNRAWSVFRSTASPYMDLDTADDVKKILGAYVGYRFEKDVPEKVEVLEIFK